MTEPTEKGRHPSPYLNDLEEWGNKQYSPGHWTGGRIPPHFKYARWPVVLFIVLMALYTITASLTALASAHDPYTRMSYALPVVVAGTLLAGSLAWFFRRRRKRPGTKRRH